MLGFMTVEVITKGYSPLKLQLPPGHFKHLGPRDKRKGDTNLADVIDFDHQKEVGLLSRKCREEYFYYPDDKHMFVI